MYAEHQVTLRARLAGLVQQPEAMESVTSEEAVALVVLAASVQAELATRMMPAVRPEKSTAARLVPIAEAAQRSGKSRRWLRDNWRMQLPFGVKKGRAVLFPEADFERWLRRP